MRLIICLAFTASLLLASTYAYLPEVQPEDESIIGINIFEFFIIVKLE